MTEEIQGSGVPPALSILLPTYNGARYLPEQLDSILQQTWEDFELLAIDDGSSDTTAAILSDYAERDNRITVFPSNGNRGQKARLVELLRSSRGPWIAIADQDDVWPLDKTERLMKRVGTANLAFGRSELIDENGIRLNRSLLDVLNANPRPGDRLSLLFRPQVSGHAMIAKREILTENLFASEAPFDWLASLVAQFSDGLVYDDQAIVLHRMHSSNSHNVNVLVRMSPWHLRLHHFRDLFTVVRRRRRGLMEGLRHLSASSIVPDENRSTFQELERLCGSAWRAPKAGSTPNQLRNSMLGLLKPMRGSDADWLTVVDHVTVLTHGLLHPKTLVRLKRTL